MQNREASIHFPFEQGSEDTGHGRIASSSIKQLGEKLTSSIEIVPDTPVVRTTLITAFEMDQ